MMEISEIVLGNADYPLLLKEIPNPPSKIFLRGNLEALQNKAVAIVGTRKATSLGERIAEDLALNLSQAGLTIVSGLAIGIDSAAHRGALRGGSPTIAVLGNGVDKIYPAQNENLAKEILDSGGAIISEFTPGTPSYKDNFIKRNRIISGLSQAIVIVEAPQRSGAISTASFAAEQGRTVFVVPGPINNPNYVGSHALIRDGATLATSAQEILEDLGIDTGITETKIIDLEPQEQIVFEIMKMAGVPLTLDQIIELSNLEPQVVNRTLAILTIKNIAKETESGYTI